MPGQVALRPAPSRAEPPLARALDRLAGLLEIYSQAAVRIAVVGVCVGTALVVGAVVANVFTRYVLGPSINGTDELANWSFLWVIWMGVSLAVRRGAVTVITLVSERGPPAWRDAVRS